MKYGHVTSEEIGNVNFALPADHPKSYTQAGHAPSDQFKVYVGCGKWGIKQWIGRLYPEGTKQKDFLHAYLEKFNSIELNGTFYRLHRDSVAKWAEAAAGKSFKFSPKWSRRITHLQRLKEVGDNTRYFIETVAALGDNLGATFLTLPPNFAAKYQDRVNAFLELIPDRYPVHLELRHEEWFEEPVFSQMMAAFTKKGIGAVITDVALRRDALHMCLTCPTGFVRFNGYGLHDSDFTRLDDWLDRLEEWRKAGVEEVYFYMHQENEEHTIVLCDYFIKALNQRMQLGIPDLELQTLS